MAPLSIVGAGLGRTGTHSLKIALETLLGGRCYHMSELIERPGDTATWHAALHGESVDWGAFLEDFVATVDWPACAFWRQLHETNPEAMVILSMRESGEAWWRSMEKTIVSGLSRPVPSDDPQWSARRAMTLDLMSAFTPGWNDRDAAIAAYEAHNEDVRRSAPPGRFAEWQPADGWGPICDMLEVQVPDEPFPHVNRTADFRASRGLND